MGTFKQTLKKRVTFALRFSMSLLISLILIAAFKLNAQPVNLVQQQKSLSVTQATVKQIYTSQIGIREKQPNSGPDVEKYLKYVNLPKGNPWCAAFVCWVYGKAGVGNPRTGWSPGLFPGARVIWSKGQIFQIAESGKLKTEEEPGLTPTTGDIFGLYFPEKHRIAHVGFIDKWDGTWLITVEGNTNISGSREGDGVYKKRRLAGSIFKVARYVDSGRPNIAGK